MDSVIEFLNSTNIASQTNGLSLSGSRNSVAYAVCNDFGSILLVYNSRRMVRKANVANNVDIRMNGPVEVLRDIVRAGKNTIRVKLIEDAQVELMYCHRSCQKITDTCRELFLIGAVSLVFHPSQSETEEYQETHAWNCNCGSICDDPYQFDLSDGDEIILKGSQFSIRVSANRHCIYMSKFQFNNFVRYNPSQTSLKSSSYESFNNFLNSAE